MTDPRATPAEIAARLRAFKVSGDPGQLWPNVSSRVRLAAQRRIYDATAEMLGSGATPPRLLGGDEVRALGIAAHVQGMGGLLGYWIERGMLQADAPVRALMAEHLEHGRQRAGLMADRLERVLLAANAGGVEPIVLKGAYTAVRYFPDPGTRPTSDIDLLVEPRQLQAMRDALRDIGLVEGEVNTNQTTWYPSGEARKVRSLELEHAHSPWSIDLHSSIDRCYFWGRWTRFGAYPNEYVRSWTVGRCRAKVFTQPLLTAHLAQHAVNDYRAIRLIRFVELVEVLRRDVQTEVMTWDSLVGLLEKTQTGVFAFPAFTLCQRLAPGCVDDDVLRYVESLATRRMRRVVDDWLRRGVGVGNGGSLDEKLMWARTPTDHLRNAAHQVARRGMALLSPVTAPRLRLLARRAMGRVRRLERTRQ